MGFVIVLAAPVFFLLILAEWLWGLKLARQGLRASASGAFVGRRGRQSSSLAQLVFLALARALDAVTGCLEAPREQAVALHLRIVERPGVEIDSGRFRVERSEKTGPGGRADLALRVGAFESDAIGTQGIQIGCGDMRLAQCA